MLPLILYIRTVLTYASTASVEVVVYVECVHLHIRMLYICYCQCKPALMFANACIHSLFTVSWPSSTVHDLHVEKPIHVSVNDTCVNACRLLGDCLNSACCKLFLYNEAQLDNHIHVDMPLHGWCVYIHSTCTLAGKCLVDLYVMVCNSMQRPRIYIICHVCTYV